VTVTAGGAVRRAEALCPSGFLVQGDKRLHVGLGSASVVDRIEIRWPSGTSQVLTNMAVDRLLKVVEPTQ
jgi:hypothetical protein